MTRPGVRKYPMDDTHKEKTREGTDYKTGTSVSG